MDRSKGPCPYLGLKPLAPHLRNSEIAAKQTLSGSRAQANQYTRLCQYQLRPKPRIASRDLRSFRFLVQSPFPLRLPFEVLDGVGYVDSAAIDTGFLKGLVQQPSGRADERMPLQVLLVARLLADENDA